jgi:hypothetical protein
MTDTQRVGDRAEIVELVNQYAAGMDLFDADLYRQCFTEPVEIDFGSWDAEAVKTMSIQEWVDYVWDKIQGLDATQHIITNHHITFQSKKKATCLCYLQAQHYIKGADCEAYTVGGYYTNSLVRTPDGWRIRRCKFTMLWSTGDIDVVLVENRNRPPRPPRSVEVW